MKNKANSRLFDKPHRAPEKLGFFFALVLAAAFFLRIWQLDMKPVHFDEGINGHFVASIWRNGFYHYDPTNFHGPLYFYILQLSELIFGFGIFGFRLATGLLQIATLILVAKHKRFVGPAAFWAAVVIAVSPAFVFYSRYSIHESLFILGQVALSYGYFSYHYEKSVRSLWWMGLSLVVLITTKETFFIFVGTWLIAVMTVTLIDKFLPRFGSREAASTPSSIPPKIPAAAEFFSVGLVCTLLVFALFTGFFMFPQGAVDMFTALQVWTKTGTAKTGHEKSFLYWIDLFQRYEWPILVSLVLSPILFFASRRSLRIIILTGFGTWLAYSLIPYKTPWLILNLIWPLAFCAGAILARGFPTVSFVPGLRTGVAISILVCVAVSVSAMWKLNFHNYAARGEPYVYVQSTIELKKTVDTIFQLTSKRPEERTMKIAALNRDSWPLPYLFIPLTNVNWGRVTDANLAGADVILSDFEDKAVIESKLKGRFFVLPFQIRDAYQGGQAYFSAEKFKDIIPSTAQTFSGGTP